MFGVDDEFLQACSCISIPACKLYCNEEQAAIVDLIPLIPLAVRRSRLTASPILILRRKV